MVTTSSNLTGGTAITEQKGNGNNHKARAAGLVATAALALGLLTGVILGQARHEAQPVAAQARDGATHGSGPADEYTQAERGGAAFVAGPFTYREDHRAENILPTSVLDTLDFGPMECGSAPCISTPAVVPGQAIGVARQQFLAWNLDLPTGGTLGPISTERQQFLDWNLQLPTGGATPVVGPGGVGVPPAGGSYP